MATESRGADPSLEHTLFAEAYRFDFFQAVRLLERLSGGRTPVGGDGPPAREVVRFLTKLSLAFPPSAIDRIEPPPPESAAPPRMTVSFLGLTGPSAVLP